MITSQVCSGLPRFTGIAAVEAQRTWKLNTLAA